MNYRTGGLSRQDTPTDPGEMAAGSTGWEVTLGRRFEAFRHDEARGEQGMFGGSGGWQLLPPADRPGIRTARGTEHREVDHLVHSAMADWAATWSAQAGIGGAIIGAPAAAAVVVGSAVVVGARGTDNALWVRTLSNGTWGPWRSWGGNLSASPAITGGRRRPRRSVQPRAGRRAVGQVDVAGRRLDRVDRAGRPGHHRAGGGERGAGQR